MLSIGVLAIFKHSQPSLQIRLFKCFLFGAVFLFEPRNSHLTNSLSYLTVEQLVAGLGFFFLVQFLYSSFKEAFNTEYGKNHFIVQQNTFSLQLHLAMVVDLYLNVKINALSKLKHRWFPTKLPVEVFESHSPWTQNDFGHHDNKKAKYLLIYFSST